MNFDPLYITFGLYLCAMISIGIVTYFKTANYGEYILGGRDLGCWMTAISAQAADFSGWILKGLSGFWGRMTRNAAIVGIVVGGLTVVLWPLTGSVMMDTIPGFIMNCLAIWLTTSFGKPIEPEVAQTFDKHEMAIKAKNELWRSGLKKAGTLPTKIGTGCLAIRRRSVHAHP